MCVWEQDMVSIHVINVSSLVLEIAICTLHLLFTSVPAGMGGFDLEPPKSDVYSHISWRFLYENRRVRGCGNEQDTTHIYGVSSSYVHPGPSMCASDTKVCPGWPQGGTLTRYLDTNTDFGDFCGVGLLKSQIIIWVLPKSKINHHIAAIQFQSSVPCILLFHLTNLQGSLVRGSAVSALILVILLWNLHSGIMLKKSFSSKFNIFLTSSKYFCLKLWKILVQVRPRVVVGSKFGSSKVKKAANRGCCCWDFYIPHLYIYIFIYI